MKSIAKFVILIASLLGLVCFQNCVKDAESVDNPMLEFVEGEDGKWFELSSSIKAGTPMSGNVSLIVKYKNGYSRQIRITLNSGSGDLYTDENFSLSEGTGDSELRIPLYGQVDDMGEFSLGITFKPLKESPVSKTIKLFADDPLDEFSFNWDSASISDKVYDNMENSTVLSIPYLNGYGRNVVINVKSDIGLNGNLSTVLNGNYEDKIAGDSGVVEIPLTGIPSVHGNVTLYVTVISAGLNKNGNVAIKVEKNTGDFPSPVFDPDLVINGSFYKNLEIGEREPVSLALTYENGFSREVLVAMNENNGIKATEFTVILKAGPGKGCLEIPLEGIPTMLGENILSGYVKLKETGEILSDINAVINVQSPGKINIEEVKVKDELFPGMPANTVILLSYTDGYNRMATVTADFSKGSGSGLSIEKNTEIQLTESGVMEIKIAGDNPVAGNYPCDLTVSTDGESPVVKSCVITVVDQKPAINFNFSETEISGSHVLLNQEVKGTNLKLHYTNGFDRKVKSIEVSGMLNANLSEVTLAGSEGVVEVPLTGIPSGELCEIDILIKIDEVVEKKHTMTLFAGEKVSYQGLEYYTIFIDVNGNGKIDGGEIWLDRNIGATSTDPGKWGELEDNRSCVGYYYYWGKSYTDYCHIKEDMHPLKDDSYKLPPANAEWADVCPKKYHVPSEDEWRFLFNHLVGTSYVAAPAAPRVQEFAGKTPEDLMSSILSLPMGGIHTAKANNQSGTTASYWTATWFNNKPVKVNITLKPNGLGQTNISITDSETGIANVRCIRD